MTHYTRCMENFPYDLIANSYIFGKEYKSLHNISKSSLKLIRSLKKKESTLRPNVTVQLYWSVDKEPEGCVINTTKHLFPLSLAGGILEWSEQKCYKSDFQVFVPNSLVHISRWGALFKQQITPLLSSSVILPFMLQDITI